VLTKKRGGTYEQVLAHRTHPEGLNERRRIEVFVFLLLSFTVAKGMFAKASLSQNTTVLLRSTQQLQFFSHRWRRQTGSAKYQCNRSQRHKAACHTFGRVHARVFLDLSHKSQLRQTS
jgi:hypothetical protein